eukprot:gene13014-8860_t
MRCYELSVDWWLMGVLRARLVSLLDLRHVVQHCVLSINANIICPAAGCFVSCCFCVALCLCLWWYFTWKLNTFGDVVWVLCFVSWHLWLSGGFSCISINVFRLIFDGSYEPFYAVVLISGCVMLSVVNYLVRDCVFFVSLLEVLVEFEVLRVIYGAAIMFIVFLFAGFALVAVWFALRGIVCVCMPLFMLSLVMTLCLILHVIDWQIVACLVGWALLACSFWSLSFVGCDVVSFVGWFGVLAPGFFIFECVNRTMDFMGGDWNLVDLIIWTLIRLMVAALGFWCFSRGDLGWWKLMFSEIWVVDLLGEAGAYLVWWVVLWRFVHSGVFRRYFGVFGIPRWVECRLGCLGEGLCIY